MKTLRRCKNNWEPENVVLIDVDSDSFNNVNIDIPENLAKKLQGSNRLKNGKNFPSRTYIYIDDGDDESPDNQHAETDTNFAQDNLSPVKFSKSKRMYAGRGLNNCYDFSMQSDGDSSDMDSPDCEFMVDSSGMLQEQWERASLKRKANVRSDQCGMTENDSFSTHYEDAQDYFGVKRNKQSYAEVPSRFDSKEVIREKDGQGFGTTIESRRRNTSFDPIKECSNDISLNTTGKTNILDKNAKIHAQEESLMEDLSNSEQQTCKCFEHFDCCLCKDNSQSHKLSSLISNEQPTYAQGKQKYKIPSDHGASGIADIGPRNLDLQVDRTSSHQNPFSVETVDCSHGFGHRDDKSEETPSSSTSSKVEIEGQSILNTSNIEDAPVEKSIVNEREKLKETDEYKRALEEELAARQRALKVQAEEAQQLRRFLKRKRAEKMRLLDMERRQKQRLEEIRETQKKDEENMNLKEMYRTEVQQELNKLKTICHDMASLLRGLGVLTNNDPSASSLQVRAAYKRALLSFHPDRASGSDVREQVEAEEKFKLISRMKDKIL
ncbi:hypothetical protein L6452_20720 [Arctium lappa]|uniref:Uncharacterized protein n=1 Tax=Arctium lappa TaxID=4217 RepID=A0ACB9BGK6_ARCLA|nr:hypothetical protein L6452_20720 [Arctium lappa]